MNTLQVVNEQIGGDALAGIAVTFTQCDGTAVINVYSSLAAALADVPVTKQANPTAKLVTVSTPQLVKATPTCRQYWLRESCPHYPVQYAHIIQDESETILAVYTDEVAADAAMCKYAVDDPDQLFTVCKILITH